jgi:hypothetical protein
MKTKIFGKDLNVFGNNKTELFTGQEKDGKKLLPSEKNPLIRRWQVDKHENDTERNYISETRNNARDNSMKSQKHFKDIQELKIFITNLRYLLEERMDIRKYIENKLRGNQGLSYMGDTFIFPHGEPNIIEKDVQVIKKFADGSEDEKEKYAKVKLKLQKWVKAKGRRSSIIKLQRLLMTGG